MSKKLELYVYTTSTWQEKGLLKIGHCLKGRHKERIKEQFNASNPEQPDILWVADLPEGRTDKHIHQQLITNGIEHKEDGAGTEWFYVKLEDVKISYNQIVYGVKRTDNFPLREEQKEAVDKAVKWFNKDYSYKTIDSASHKNRFLLNAKMRFGKCFTGIHIAKAIEAKKTIIVTYKPRVIGEWMSAVNNHVDFENWIGMRAKKGENKNEVFLDDTGKFPEHSGSLVLCVSLQDLDIDEKGNLKNRLKKVLEIKWDLLIFDEVHFGGRTDRVKNILKYVNPTYRLDLSGTPFRLIGTVDFCPEQVFTYSYLDEQKNKKKEIQNDSETKHPFIYRQMPDMNLSTIEITDKDIKDQKEKFMTDDRDFSLNELFKSNSLGFIHNDAVDHFLESLSKREHGATALSIYGKLGEQLGLPEKRHSVWWLNRVQSIRQLIKKLKRHPIFSQYEIINAAGGKAGDDFSDDDLSDEIFAKNKKDIIDKLKKVNSNKINKIGTITLTCRKFLTGVTIKQWDSILILNDIQSAESYFQAIFRIQSAWFDEQHNKVLKPVGYVFDFAISRCLRTTYDYADALTDQLDQQDSHKLQICRDNLKKVIDGLCETMEIKQFYEGSLKSDPVTSRQIFEAVSSEGSKVALARRITSDALVSFTSLLLLEKYPHLFEALKNVKGYRSQQTGSLEDFVQMGKEAKRKKLEKDKLDMNPEKIEKDNEDFVEKEKDKEKKSKKKWYTTQIKRLAICMADFVYMTKFREYKIDHVIETKDSEFFKDVTGISKDDFSELCNKGFIHRESLNRIVREFRHQEESSLKPEEYIFEHIRQITSKKSA